MSCVIRPHLSPATIFSSSFTASSVSASRLAHQRHLPPRRQSKCRLVDSRSKWQKSCLSLLCRHTRRQHVCTGSNSQSRRGSGNKQPKILSAEPTSRGNPSKIVANKPGTRAKLGLRASPTRKGGASSRDSVPTRCSTFREPSLWGGVGFNETALHLD